LSEIKPLAGVKVLVTRPVHQAKNLAEGIQAAGGYSILFPVLEITDIEDLQPLLDIIARLNEFDLAIFVSPNAVNKTMPLIKANGALPSNMRIAVVGKGSANALKQLGVADIIVPTGRYDSEALLDQSELQQMKNKRVVVFRGNGGRKLLGDTLIERGARLEYAECYHRGKPNVDAASLLTAWSDQNLNAVTITSSEGLYNLFDMIGPIGQQLLKTTPLFTAHERIAQKARDLGLAEIILTPAGDEGLLQGLIDYFSSNQASGITSKNE
jgi:uroporphyrinogen-III synthase